MSKHSAVVTVWVTETFAGVHRESGRRNYRNVTAASKQRLASAVYKATVNEDTFELRPFLLAKVGYVAERRGE